jgi:phage shock protein PspC (stress-responsive transcriptional regulator)
MAIPSRHEQSFFEPPLYRSRRTRMIGGVCGGLAEWLGWDVTVVRFIFTLSTVLSGFGAGVLVYGVLWLVLPEAPHRRPVLLEWWEEDDL